MTFFDVVAGVVYGGCILIILWAVAVVIRSILEDLGQ